MHSPPTSFTYSAARRFAALLFVLVMLGATAALAGGTQTADPRRDPQDEILAKIGVDERIGARVPPELAFTDADGKPVRLGAFLGAGPVILTLNYYACPMLCPLTFRNLINTMSGIKGLSLDRDFRIVTISIDPDETVAKARDKATETFAMLREVENPERRWAFLSGKAPEIRRLTETVGYKYVKTDATNFAHPAAIVVLTPDGRVARYLYGIEHKPRDLKLALMEAADGQIGGSALINRVILACFHYDPAGRRYALAAKRIMTGAGVVTLAAVAVPLAVLWRRERKGREGGAP